MNITPEQLRDISEQVYRKRLEDDCPEVRDHKGVVTRKGNVQRMLEKDAEKDPNDNGKKLRGRAGSYDLIVRATLEAIGFFSDVEPEELETLIADKSANQAADAILKEFKLLRRANEPT